MGLIAIGFLLLGCGSGPPPDGFELLTGPLGCYAGGERGAAGTLEVDSEYGTRFNGIPVMWPAGFTGVRVGDEVEVHDASGTAIATTGRKYYISVAYADRARDMLERLGIDAYPAAANCGYPWDFVDCSRPATGQPGLAEPEAACAGIGARRGAAPVRLGAWRARRASPEASLPRTPADAHATLSVEMPDWRARL